MGKAIPGLIPRAALNPSELSGTKYWLAALEGPPSLLGVLIQSAQAFGASEREGRRKGKGKSKQSKTFPFKKYVIG